MTFRVNQKVVCVDAAPDQRYTPWPIIHGTDLDGLKVNQVYTIRAIGKFRDVLCVWLAEITRYADSRGEYGYSPRRFRPVVERKTDISIFTALLKPTPAKIKEHAIKDALAAIYLSATGF